MYINNLITGTMTLGSGGSTPSGHSDTRVTYTTESGYADWSGEIEGELNYDSIPNIDNAKTVDIGTSVTSFYHWPFEGCYHLTDATFQGKDKATVQDMEYYPFGLNGAGYDGVTIHCSDGEIQIQFEGM